MLRFILLTRPDLIYQPEKGGKGDAPHWGQVLCAGQFGWGKIYGPTEWWHVDYMGG